MQIVIEIDEKYRDKIQKEINHKCLADIQIMKYANGLKILPKNHGDLIDAMKLKSAIFGLTITDGEFGRGFGRGLDATVECINDAPTIIEEVKADERAT